jgi:long-subunit acyl-CoA synthetase (AMP-forming)
MIELALQIISLLEIHMIFIAFAGYGLTESCACCTIMDSDENSTGRTGPPLQGVLVKLIDWD